VLDAPGHRGAGAGRRPSHKDNAGEDAAAAATMAAEARIADVARPALLSEQWPRPPTSDTPSGVGRRGHGDPPATPPPPRTAATGGRLEAPRSDLASTVAPRQQREVARTTIEQEGDAAPSAPSQTEPNGRLWRVQRAALAPGAAVVGVAAVPVGLPLLACVTLSLLALQVQAGWLDTIGQSKHLTAPKLPVCTVWQRPGKNPWSRPRWTQSETPRDRRCGPSRDRLAC